MGKAISSPTFNPCIQCGACCCYFRVEFYWREIEPTSQYRVPAPLTEDLNPFKKCMKGTLEKTGNRCVALSGKVGRQVACTIYPNRPSPCRNFAFSYAPNEDGTPGPKNKRCDEARAANGLKPLEKPITETAQPSIEPLGPTMELWGETQNPSPSIDSDS